MKSLTPRLALLAISIAVFVGCPAPRLFAADGTWTNTAGGTLPWTNLANWSGGIAPEGTDATANFATINIGANTTVTLAGTNPTVGTLLFADTSGSQTWGMNNTGTINLSVTSGSPVISNSVTTTLNAILAGSQGFTKAGSGVLILGGTNTYAGNTVISEGFLRLGASDTLPNDSVVVFANNGNNKELTVFSASDTIGGLSSSGGGGTIVVQNNRATNSGTLNLNVAAATSLTFDGFIRDSGTNVAVNNLNIIKSGAGTQVFSGGANVNYSGATTVSEGTLEFSGATVNNNSAIEVAGSNAAIRFNIASGDLVRTNAISGGGGLVKAGTNSALTLSNVNTYTGSTVLEEGFIRLGVSDRIANASVLRFATTNNARFQMQGFSETLGGVDSGSSSGTQVIEGATNAAATLTLGVASGSYVYSGFLRDSASGTNANNLSVVKGGAGTQVLAGGTTQVSYSGGTTVSGGVLEFAGTNSVANNSAITLGGGTVRFSGGGARSNTIAGSGNLEKTGANTLTLSADNTYTGNTTVTEGDLRLATNGSLRFVIGGSGTNNQLRGTGSVQLEGVLNFDLIGAATNADAQWVIISNSVAVTYGTNFLVSGFNGAGGNWTNTTNGVNYVFAQSNGVLSVKSTNPAGNYPAWISYWAGLYPGFTNTTGTDDPDGDSYDNNQEFAFDGNPMVGTPALMTVTQAGTNAVFSWVERTNGVTYILQKNSTLTNAWTDTGITGSVAADQTGVLLSPEYVRKEFTTNASGKDFYRVRATTP